MIPGYRGAVVGVALIGRLDRSITLSGKRADYIAERHVGEPGNTVVGGLAREHLVARDGRVAHRTGGGPALVIPHGKQSASVADRKIRLPLSTGSSIRIQFKWRAKGHPLVGGADIFDVTRIRAGAVLRIDIANYAVVGGRLTPTHVTPGVGAIHADKIRIGGAISTARGCEVSAGDGVGPSIATVS